MATYTHGNTFAFDQVVAVGTADYDLVVAPTSPKSLFVQGLTICITVANAATCVVTDESATVNLFAIPTNLAVGAYSADCGPLGIKLTAAEKLIWNASGAGIGATVSGFGYIA